MKYLTNAWLGSLLSIVVLYLCITFIYLDWWWFLGSKQTRSLFVVTSVVVYLLAVTCPAWKGSIYDR